MKPLTGVEPAQADCDCLLCNTLRTHGHTAEAADLPPAKTADELMAEIKAALAGGVW